MSSKSQEKLESSKPAAQIPNEAVEIDIEAVGEMIDEMNSLISIILMDRVTRDSLLTIHKEKMTVDELEAVPYAQVLNRIDTILESDIDILEKEAKLIEFLKICRKEYRGFAEDYLIELMKTAMATLQQKLQDNEIDLNNPEKQLLIFSEINIRNRIRFAVTKATKQAFAMECCRFYREIRKDRNFPRQLLPNIHGPMGNTLYLTARTMELPESVTQELLKRSAQDKNEELKMELPSISGKESCSWCYTIPFLIEFPQKEPHINEARDLLADVREELIELVSKVPSYKLFMEIENMELKEFLKHLDEFNQKLQSLYLQATAIRRPLLLAFKQTKTKNGEKAIYDYLYRLNLHLNNVWENVVLPAYVLFAHIKFGEDSGPAIL
ncbi:hypothetical protein ACFL10_00585 [Patescibacteria group bacterium]